jgi:hypothetical protein
VLTCCFRSNYLNVDFAEGLASASQVLSVSIKPQRQFKSCQTAHTKTISATPQPLGLQSQTHVPTDLSSAQSAPLIASISGLTVYETIYLLSVRLKRFPIQLMKRSRNMDLRTTNTHLCVSIERLATFRFRRAGNANEVPSQLTLVLQRHAHPN